MNLLTLKLVKIWNLLNIQSRDPFKPIGPERKYFMDSYNIKITFK